MERIGLLLHPFYAKSLVKYTKELYKNSIKEYKRNIVITASMRHKETIENFLVEYESEIMDYIAYDKDIILTKSINGKSYDVNISGIIDRDFALLYIENLKDISGLEYTYKDFVGVYLAMLTDELAPTRKYTLFKGDIIPFYNKDALEALYKDLWIEDSLVGLYSLGSMYFVVDNIKRILENHISESEINNTIIDIYGEYLNQCVLDMARIIRGYGYKVNIVANKSIAYGEDNIIYDSAYATVVDSIDDYELELMNDEFLIEEISNGDKKQYLIIDKELV